MNGGYEQVGTKEKNNNKERGVLIRTHTQERLKHCRIGEREGREGARGGGSEGGCVQGEKVWGVGGRGVE